MFFRNRAKKQTEDCFSKLDAEKKKIEEQQLEAERRYMEQLGIPEGFKRGDSVFTDNIFYMIDESKNIRCFLESDVNAKEKKDMWKCDMVYHIDDIGSIGTCVYGETAKEAYNYARLMMAKVC